MTRRCRAAAVLFGLLVLLTVVPATPSAAQGSASVQTDGSQVTVTVTGIPGHQVRVELEDDSIAATGLLDPSGQTVMIMQLAPGEHELEVITFDPVGTPTVVGTYGVVISGPPPGAPGLEVRAGTPADNRTVFVVTGPAGAQFSIDVVREGDVAASLEGEIGPDGRATPARTLASGPWRAVATLSNPSGRSPATSADFAVELGTPAAPTLALTSTPGASPAVVAITGNAGASVQVIADLEGARVTEETDLDVEGKGSVELALREDGTWAVTGIATNADGTASPEGVLEGGVEINRDGPTLEVELIGGGSDEFSYRVTTDPGVTVLVESETAALRQQFVAEEAVTEFHVEVPEGDHSIQVTATDSAGNTNFVTLSTGDGGSGSNLGILALIVLAILAAFGLFAYLRRQEIADWWNTRQYH
jgi:hypothetical protein